MIKITLGTKQGKDRIIYMDMTKDQFIEEYYQRPNKIKFLYLSDEKAELIINLKEIEALMVQEVSKESYEYEIHLNDREVDRNGRPTVVRQEGDGDKIWSTCK